MEDLKSGTSNGPEGIAISTRREKRRGAGLCGKVLVGLAILLLVVAWRFPGQRVVFTVGFEGPEDKGDRVGSVFQWDEIQPSEQIQFHACYDGYECAKLKLPLDYFNGTFPDETISVALTKLSSKVSSADPRYGGPILLNPGGPGGSGVAFALQIANNLQTIVDSAEDPSLLTTYTERRASTAKYFDIIGFDPRGIGQTQPRAFCLPDSSYSWAWQLRLENEGILDSSDAALGRLWQMTHTFGDSCQQAIAAEDGPDIKQYMSTASVARDMLEIAERHEEWVVNTRNKMSGGCAVEKPHRPVKEVTAKMPVFERGTTKLQYWGFSYGTYLGATFASMFPDRVSRLVLDGVVNTDDYNQGLGNNSLTDAEKDMMSFYTSCLNLGAPACPLAAGASSIHDVKGRLDGIVNSLYHNPLPVPSAGGPEVVTYSDIKHLVFSSLYAPETAYPAMANILAAIEARNGSVFTPFLRLKHSYSCPVNSSVPPRQIPSDTPTVAILCGDSEDLHDNITDFERYWHDTAAKSPTAGSIWAALRMSCLSWPIKAVHRYADTFGGNTSHPILWVSNVADPVTPLISGKRMSARFPGSVVLTQDSAGHCSLSTPTACTLAHIRAYFQTGIIPPPDTLCIPPPSPFSLNSTDPNSPFYQPDLLPEASYIAQFQSEGEQELYVADNRVSAEEMASRPWPPRDIVGIEQIKVFKEQGKGLQSSFAQQEYFGMGQRGRKGKEILGAAVGAGFTFEDIRKGL